VLRSFQLFQQRRDIIVALSRAQAHWARLYFEWASRPRLARLSQSQAEQTIHNHLEWLAAAPDLLFEKQGDIVVDRKRGSHILML